MGPKIKNPVQQFFGPWANQQSLKKWKAYLKHCESSSNLTKFGHKQVHPHPEGRQNGHAPGKITATASNAVALQINLLRAFLIVPIVNGRLQYFVKSLKQKAQI